MSDVGWTRQVVELQNASFAEQDDTLGEFVERYRPSRIAKDQTGMGEKPVQDAQRRYGAQRAEGALMTPAVRSESAASIWSRRAVSSASRSGVTASPAPTSPARER